MILNDATRSERDGSDATDAAVDAAELPAE
jgi:hypothetical protein